MYTLAERSFLGPLTPSTVYVEFLTEPQLPRCTEVFRAVRGAASGLGQRGCARSMALLARTSSCDARHGDVRSWGRRDAAAAVAAAQARSQTRYRGGGSGGGYTGLGPLPPPFPPPSPSPQRWFTRSPRRAARRQRPPVRLSGVRAPFPRHRGGAPGLGDEG